MKYHNQVWWTFWFAALFYGLLSVVLMPFPYSVVLSVGIEGFALAVAELVCRKLKEASR